MRGYSGAKRGIFDELDETVDPFPGVASVAPIRSWASPDTSGDRFCGEVPANGGTLPCRAADSSIRSPRCWSGSRLVGGHNRDHHRGVPLAIGPLGLVLPRPSSGRTVDEGFG